MMRRSVLMLSVVVLAVALSLPAMAQGGPGGPPPPGGPGPTAGPGGMMGGMGGGMMSGMMSSPPVIAVAGDYVYVAWMGMLTQYKADDLTVVKSVPMPMPERMRGMGRDRERGGRGADRPEGAAPAAPANP